MMKALSFRFYNGLGPFSMLTIKRCSKRVFLEGNLTKSFTACKFRNKVTMTMIFFSKSLKFGVDSRKGLKKSEKVFGFNDNCIWIDDNKFSQSRKGYLSLAVNV